MHPMFTAVLLKIAKIWKQPKCPPADKMDKENILFKNNKVPGRPGGSAG